MHKPCRLSDDQVIDEPDLKVPHPLIAERGFVVLPLKEIDWEDAQAAIPAFLTVAMIPLTFSIANGLAFGITAHAAFKLLRGQATRTDWFLFLLASLFVGRFIWMGAGA